MNSQTLNRQPNKYAIQLIENGLVAQIINKFAPVKIILFGSRAAGRPAPDSDIDLCIIMPAADKRTLIANLYYEIESDRPIDLLVYTPDEWERCVSDKTSFASKIAAEGIVLHG